MPSNSISVATTAPDGIVGPALDPSLRGTVDVVIPVRNGARTIMSTLASVLGQTIAPRRIIVVNDGSTDDTVSVVARVGSNRIELVTTPPCGISHARNSGIEASRAEFIAFLDADDRWHPDKLQRQLRVFAENADVVLVYCGFAMQQPSGAVVEVRAPKLRGFVFNHLLAGHSVGNSSGIVVRREALLHTGGYDENLSCAEDTDLHLRLAHQYEFDFASDTLAYVIENPESVTRRQISMDRQRQILLENVSIYEKWCPPNNLPHRTAQNFRKRMTYLAVREKYGWRWMLQLRAELQRRSPISARKIWPNHAIFAGWIALATLKYTVRLLARTAKFAHRVDAPARTIAMGNSHDQASPEDKLVRTYAKS